MCSSSGGQNCIVQHLVSSHWNKWLVYITKIQFYKYEHMVVKLTYEFFGCDYCILLTINMLCRGYVYPVVKLIKKILCVFKMHVCWVYLVIKSFKLLISSCIFKVTYIRLLNLLKIFGVYLHYLSKEAAFTFLATPWTAHPTTQCNIAEDPNLLHLRFENIKPKKSLGYPGTESREVLIALTTSLH